MKISSTDAKPAVAPATTDRPAKPGARVNAPAEASAKVDLSSAAVAATSGGQPDASFDAAKVERIAQAIRDGKFEVNAEAIANKLIINAAELLGRKAS